MARYQPLNDLFTFGNEQSGLPSQVSLRQIAIAIQPRIADVVDRDERHYKLCAGENRDDSPLKFAARHMNLPRAVDQHIDLAPHAEFVEIDSRLNRKTSP